MRSFSGIHDWDPTILADTDAHEAGTAVWIVEAIESGICPRCEGPLPTPPEYPAGTRITKCRSIPICGRCGGDEVYEQISTGLSTAGCWPVPTEQIEARKARFEAPDRENSVWPCQKQVAILSTDSLITDDGAVPIINPCNTRGWAQYGFPDES